MSFLSRSGDTSHQREAEQNTTTHKDPNQERTASSVLHRISTVLNHFPGSSEAQAISSPQQNRPPGTNSPYNMTSIIPQLRTEKKPPITCHVLNTVTGLPASNIAVTLTLVRPYGPSQPLTATTNADGRVTSWTSATGGPSLEELFANAHEHQGPGSATGDVAVETGEKGPQGLGSGEMVWALKFDVGRYFGGEGFWEVVEIRFRTKVEVGGREHWHVPLLLSPYSYSTYRGS